MNCGGERQESYDFLRALNITVRIPTDLRTQVCHKVILEYIRKHW